MAFGATCDRCGCDLLGRDLRYNVTLEIAQAYDPMEISSKDLRRDLRGELEEMIKTMEALPASEVKKLEDETYASFRFDLCPQCAGLLRQDAQHFFAARIDADVGAHRIHDIDRRSLGELPGPRREGIRL